MPAFFERMFDRTNRKGSLADLREVSEEGLNVVFHLVRANRIHRIHDALLLECLPRPETAHIGTLDKVSLMGRKLDNPNSIHF
jgi:hypothetical protein